MCIYICICHSKFVGNLCFLLVIPLSNCLVSSRIILDLFVLRWSIVSAHNQDLLKRI